MDISKLSLSTQRAKKLIKKALGLNKLEFTTKRVKLDPKKPLATINEILSTSCQQSNIDVQKVIRNICGENGAAKKLANSMLTKSKKQDGFKKLAEELEKIKYDDKPADDTTLKTEIAGTPESTKAQTLQSLLEKYIEKRGKKGSDGKDAREIGFLKLLCAALVLEAINQLKKNETPKESLPASELETGSVDDARKDEQAQKQTGLNVKLIRTVGNVENMEANDLRYVISEDETELIIYPNFAGDNILLKYVANHLYRIAGENESHYPDGNNTFPAQKTYCIGKYDKDKLDNIKQANEKGWISDWEDFEKKELDGFIHSLGADGNFSDQWLTYGEAIEMTEEGWNEILDKRAKEKAKKKAEEARKKAEAEEEAKKKAEEERLRKEAEERNEASNIITSAKYLGQPKELSDTEKLINDNIEKIKKISMHFNQTFHCHFNEKEFNTETFMQYLLKPGLERGEIIYYLHKTIGYYYKSKYSDQAERAETKLSTLIDDFIKHMRQFNNNNAIGTANYIIAICVPGITFPSSGQNVAAIDNKLKEITDILFNKIPPGNTNQELSNKLKEIERYGSELKKEYDEYCQEYRELVNNFNEQRENMRNLVRDSLWAGHYIDKSSIEREVMRSQLIAHGYYDRILLKITEANNKLLDICKEFEVDITNTDIFVLSDLNELIDKCNRLSDRLNIYYEEALSRLRNDMPI